MNRIELAAAVEEAFAELAPWLAQWDDPHPPPKRIVADEEYSRVTNPAKWRIAGVRADAWAATLVAHGLATVVVDATVEWETTAPTEVTRTDLVVPEVADGLALVVGRSRIGSVADAGLTLGVGVPAAFVVAIPDCGCDACDSGSADVLAEVDAWIGGVVAGTFRHLVRSSGTITVRGPDLRSAAYVPPLPDVVFGERPSGWSRHPGPDGAVPEAAPPSVSRRPFDVDAVLANPVGWREWSGPSWPG